MLLPDANPLSRPALPVCGSSWVRRRAVESPGKPLLASAVLLGGLIGGALAHAELPVRIDRSEVRLFGYQLGDVLTEPIDVQLAPGYRLDVNALPKAGKRAGWFVLRAIRHEDHLLSNGGTRVHLEIEVQLVNAPKQAQTINVPPIALRFVGATTVNETLPSLAVDVVPLGTGELRSDLPEVRPLREAPLIDLEAAEGQLRWSGLVAAVAAGWLLLTAAARWLKPRDRRPFAQAARELRSLTRTAGSLEGARLAVQRVHRAFDQAAGHRLFAEGVSSYTHRVGADAGLQAQTEAFFQLSRQLFFAPDTAAPPADLGAQLKTLVQAWQRFERRHP